MNEGENGRREGGREGKKEGWPGEKQNRAETRETRSNRNEFSETQHFELK